MEMIRNNRIVLLFGVVIDTIKVVVDNVVVVIKFNHIRVGKTICCKLELLKVFFFETFWANVYFINT
jgi:hypothetical protein